MKPLPLLTDVLLSSGLVVRHGYLPNGAQFAAPTTRYWMTKDEYAEYDSKREHRSLKVST